MNILGISAFYHDSSAAILVDGKIIAAVQEERLSRVKHDSRFPALAISSCLEIAGLRPTDIDYIVFYEKPFLKFERLLETYLAFAPRGFLSFLKAMPVWLDEKLFQKRILKNHFVDLGFNEKVSNEILFSDHHLSHAASAFYPSPFEEAIVLTMDGVGEWTTTSVYLGKKNGLTKIKEITFPHSLGLLYSAFTYHCGFKVNSGEYKLMGLAPYGVPRYTEIIKQHLIDIKDDGSFRLNMNYFNYCTGLTMTNKRFDELFQFSRRDSESDIKEIHLDLAASIQQVTEEVILKMTKHLRLEFGIENLCLAGGVALNCVANGKISSDKIFTNIWVQPAAGDAGGALGAALTCHYDFLKNSRKIDENDSMNGSFLGPSFSEEEIQYYLNSVGAHFNRYDDRELFELVSNELASGGAIGLFQGRMEFGPRALGNRSILGDARSKETQKNLNLKIKYRESFRPFAPAVLEEDVSSYFDFQGQSPYMLMVAPVKKEHRYEMSEVEKTLFGIEKLNIARSCIPAVTHIDYSARIQTVSKRTNPRFYRLIETFKDMCKVPVLVNTSFNIRGEPIVCSPEDAFNCFMGTDMDLLVLENIVLRKKDQPDHLLRNYKDKFQLD